MDEVRRWYFEVWNEPNLYESFFRGGSQAKYFELYKITALTIKKVDPQLRVGGPATSNFNMDPEAIKKAEALGKPFDPMTIAWRPVWIEDLLMDCHQNDLPVDFASTHPPPQDFAIDGPAAPNDKGYRASAPSIREDCRSSQQ